jgi:PKD repeat protein
LRWLPARPALADAPRHARLLGRTVAGHGGTASTTFTLTVNNVAPTATFSAPTSVSEGSAINFSLTAPLDPSSADTAAGFTYAFDCGDGTGFGVFSATSSRSCPTADNGTRTVAGKIQDKDGGVTTYTASVTVDNVAPTATFSAPASVDQGTSIALSLTSPLDPSSADTTAGFTYAFDCGDGGGFGAYGASSSTNCPTAASGTRSVGGKIRDKDGGVSTYTATVTVNAVAPSVNAPATAPEPSNEGSAAAASATFSAPGANAPFTCTVDYGDGSGVQAGGVSGNSCTGPNHTYADNGSYTVTITVTDKLASSGFNSSTHQLNNVAPVITPAANQAASEDTSASFALGSFTDPGADSPWAVDVDWGDASPHSTFNVTATGSLGSQSHTYADNGNYTVTVTVTDKDSASDSTTFSVAVSNVPPTADFTVDTGNVPEGSPSA